MHNTLHSQFSFWETQTYFNNIDLAVIGSGIVGLNAAIHFKKKHPKAKVVVLERGILPNGASTKNAGFACFGSVSELQADLEKNNENDVWHTVEMRIKGLELLRKTIGDKHIHFQRLGGYELFTSKQLFEKACSSIDDFNKKIKSLTKSSNTYQVSNKHISRFGFKSIEGIILNQEEGQLDTGNMMQYLLQYAMSLGVIVLNNISVSKINDLGNKVILNTNIGSIYSKLVIVATNGFAKQLLKLKDVKPARAQVLITKPVKNLTIKGTFHYDEGFYYFRNVGDRILLGGGRNLDFETETTHEFAFNHKIHQQLDKLLKDMILPHSSFEIEQRWCGIMGVGSEKKPIIEKISPHVVCAVRMGGMGVAIGSLVGKLAIEKLKKV